MDVFCDTREVMCQFERYVVDLRKLFLFHGLACGSAENFCDLAVKLEESRALRLDLPALLRNIRDLEEGMISADEMLTVLALASGGEDLVEGRAGSAGMMRTVGMLQMMLAGVGSWAETRGSERTTASVKTSSGQERIFLELAIEELRLQMSDVTRRMSDLEPQVQGRAGPAAEAEEVGQPRGPAPQERRRLSLEEKPQEPVTKPDAAAAETAKKEAAELAARQERERFAAWPLEERVSSAPALAERNRAAKARGLTGEQENSKRQSTLRLAGIAAGLLLATIGIYGSLRSASARAGRDSSARGVSRPVDIPRRPAPATPPAPAASSTSDVPPILSGNGRTDQQRPASAATTSAPKVAPELTKNEPVHEDEAKIAVPTPDKKIPGPTLPTTAMKGKQYDVAGEETLAERPSHGKYLFVPADVMEKHLISSRKPVVPADARSDEGPARVVLNAFIGTDGTVSRTDVVEGPPKLINSAMAAVSWRRYRPFLLRGKPTEVVTPVTLNYATAQ